MRMSISKVHFAGALLFLGLVAVGIFMCCGGTGNVSTPSSMATVNTILTDPPTCGFMFDHVYVTITKVQANVSADVGTSDSGWVNLVDLTSSPKQLDLMSLASTACTLTQLGSTTGLPPGKYQQFRLYLLGNSPASGTPVPSTNACGSGGYNCVVPSGGAPQILQLSSEAQTGIKIPSSQITNGGLTILAGQSADLSIDFNSCASIVHEGNGKYRLKPVLHAGEVAVNNNSISGKVVDSSSSNPVSGAIVLLEQPDSNNIDRVMAANLSAADGTFIFCPLPNPGGNATYDVVVAASIQGSTTVTTYNATIAFKVPVGTALGDITVVPEASPSQPATLSVQVTSVGDAGATVADVTLSALQQATPTGGPAIQVTIPVFAASSQPPVVTTTPSPSSGPACPSGTDCYNYSLLVPASNPQVGTFSGGSVTYTAPAAGAVNFSLEGAASACTGVTPTGGMINSIAVTPGNTTSVSTALVFSGCTAPQ